MLAVAFSPDEQWLWGASRGAVELFDLDGVRRQVLRGPRDVVVALDYSPDSSRLATLTHDGMVHIWNLASHAPEIVRLPAIRLPEPAARFHGLRMAQLGRAQRDAHPRARSIHPRHETRGDEFFALCGERPALPLGCQA